LDLHDNAAAEAASGCIVVAHLFRLTTPHDLPASGVVVVVCSRPQWRHRRPVTWCRRLTARNQLQCSRVPSET